MTPTEIGLRLLQVGDLCGDKWLLTVQWLEQNKGATPEELEHFGLTTAQTRRFFSLSVQELEKSLDWLSQANHHLISANDAAYPESLRAIADYPGVILVKGEVSVLKTQQLAVVGSRAHSWYGERWGRLFCEALAQSGFTITSGMALGIDSIAHRAALNVGGKSVAVLGNGLYSLYPRRHSALASQLIDCGGALVSEFPLAAHPKREHFPRRNRIISGLSRGVLVVEAALRSGSLVTARSALEQGREVFALPGPIGSPGSEGAHWLIKQGATLVTSASEILETLQYGLSWLPEPGGNSFYSSDQEEVALPFPELLANVGDEVTPVDVVAERAGQPVPVTAAQLLELELAGWIAAVPGGYVRLRRASHVRRTNVLV
ncbi:DNA processing protein [Kosakonia arachidis]|uniref:DNA processing protein n=1 Tax=Kosakonia arachidis TaxID=551989 RepID=A0A1I7EBB1_9ENTR|nr:DNA-protecting protein DprA [Kosakonia arachidis]SFU21211.1 DNA processing protein [Kosakonia arachidis]